MLLAFSRRKLGMDIYIYLKITTRLVSRIDGLVESGNARIV